MSFQVSPGVNISEIDLTTIVPAVSSTEGAIAGVFHWGPINKAVLIDSETTLVSRFGKPDANNAETFLLLQIFLNMVINSTSVVLAKLMIQLVLQVSLLQ